MDRDDVPAGFAMALARNEEAVNAYAMMTREEKQAILNKAHHARSKEEMRQIVSEIAKEAI